MTDFPEAVLGGNGVGPSLHRLSRDFDCSTTHPADQMMVMTGRTPAISGLALVGSDDVEFAGVGHQLQCAIDRGQAYAFAVMSQVVVNLLGRSKVMPIRQHLLDRSALSGAALRRAPVGRLSAHRSDRHGSHVDDLHG
jgi:hypothetical protein